MRDHVRRRAEDQQARAIAQGVIAREQRLIYQCIAMSGRLHANDNRQNRAEPYQTLRVANGLLSYTIRLPRRQRQRYRGLPGSYARRWATSPAV